MKARRRTNKELAELAVEVINRRRVGMSFHEIGQELNASVGTCHRVFHKAISNIPKTSIKELRLLQYERLEEIFKNAIDGSQTEGLVGVQHTKVALSALEQIAKLNGLNAPERRMTEITGKDGGPIQTEDASEKFEELTQEERDAIRKIAEKRLKERGELH